MPPRCLSENDRFASSSGCDSAPSSVTNGLLLRTRCIRLASSRADTPVVAELSVTEPDPDVDDQRAASAVAPSARLMLMMLTARCSRDGYSGIASVL